MNDDKKATVSRSPAMICSADAPDENAERITPEQVATKLFYAFRCPEVLSEQDKLLIEIMADHIREAVNAEREFVLKFVSGHSWSGRAAAKDFRIYHSR